MPQEGILERFPKPRAGRQEPGWTVPERPFIVVTDVMVLQACTVSYMIHVMYVLFIVCHISC